MDIGRAEIDDWHKARGWEGIGYHFVIRRSGVVELGRGIKRVGAHVRGYNSKSIAVCWVGGVGRNGKPRNNLLPRQRKALEATVTFLMYTYPDAEVLGHRDFPNVTKACPSFDIECWLKSRNIHV